MDQFPVVYNQSLFTVVKSSDRNRLSTPGLLYVALPTPQRTVRMLVYYRTVPLTCSEAPEISCWATGVDGWQFRRGYTWRARRLDEGPLLISTPGFLEDAHNLRMAPFLRNRIRSPSGKCLPAPMGAFIHKEPHNFLMAMVTRNVARGLAVLCWIALVGHVVDTIPTR